MMNDAEFRRLLEYLDLSWEGYRRVRKGVKKRLARRLQALGINRVEDYLAALDSDSELKADCRLLLTVSISRLFRDRDLWRLMEEDVLPRLAGRETIRAWSAGCACGEEAYSLRIVYETWQSRRTSAPPLELLATDLNPAYLEQARAGVYQRSSLKDVPEELRATYFEKAPGRERYRVAENLKRGVVFRRHDLLSGLSPGVFDLILMRNSVLTYSTNGRKAIALRTVAESLTDGGFLVIGSTEMLPPGRPDLRPFGGRSDIFQRQIGGAQGNGGR